MHRTYSSIARKACLLIVCSLALASKIFAGTCPSAANYTNPSNPTGAQVTLASLNITNCYYIAANGSDSNGGASEASPWAHAPGMPNCTGNCASNTPSAGTGYIFRGGDTWHYGSGTPAVGGTWNWTWSGSSTAFIYIGVDPGWYSGSSWTRPVMNGDNPTSTSLVSSCSYTIGSSNTFMNIQGPNAYFLDNFEWTGLCWSNCTSNNNYLNYHGASGYNSTTWIIENNYVHGWTTTSDQWDGCGTAFQGVHNYFGVTLQFNVVDGSDSDDITFNWGGQGTDAYILQYNIFRHMGGITVSDDCHLLHDNIWEYMNNVNPNQSGTHSDVMFCYGEANDATHAADGTPNIIYNNIFRYIATEYEIPVSYIYTGAPPANKTDYFFNNIFHDIYNSNGGNYVVWCDGGSCNSGTAIGLMNNTFEAALPNYGSCIICDSPNVTITSINNHWITNNGTGISAVFANTANVTETTPVYQTVSVANGQGYTSSNDFAPTASSDATVGTGTNESSGLCSTMSSAGASAAAVSACEYGTTAGCSYNATNHTVICPAITAVARPSTGAWDVGAYQFNGSVTGTPPSAPTNLKAAVN